MDLGLKDCGGSIGSLVTVLTHANKQRIDFWREVNLMRIAFGRKQRSYRVTNESGPADALETEDHILCRTQRGVPHSQVGEGWFTDLDEVPRQPLRCPINKLSSRDA